MVPESGLPGIARAGPRCLNGPILRVGRGFIGRTDSERLTELGLEQVPRRIEPLAIDDQGIRLDPPPGQARLPHAA